MIRNLIQAGYRLSGTCDIRLSRGLCLTALEGLFSAMPYALLYLLLERLFEGTASPSWIIGLTAAMLLCLLARITLGVFALPAVFTGAYAMMGEARIRVAEHLRHLPIGWFTRARSGDISSRLTGDLELVEHLWSHFLGVAVSSLSAFAFLLVFLCWLDPQLALAALSVLPLATLAMWRGQHLAARESEAMLQANSNAQAELHDYVHGIAVIRSFGRFGTAWSRLNRALDAQHKAMVRIELRPAPWVGVFACTIEAGFVLVVLWGAFRIAGGSMHVQTLLLFAVISLPLFRLIYDVGLATLLLRFGQRAMERVQVLLDEPPLPEPAMPRQPNGYEIVFDEVNFSYGNDTPRVLHGISCTLPERAMTAVVGPSGAGKSTLVHLIARLWDVDGGTIRMGGVDVRAIGTEALHAQIAMVFQDVVLFSGTVLENLRIGRPEATRKQAIEAARQANAHDFIERLPYGYDTWLTEDGGSLSGGERQRLSIARALLKNAPILLLDEATASIDPSAAADIQQALNALVRDRTVVVIAHHLRSIAHADRILVLEGGRIVEAGRHESLLAANGLYAKAWRRQSEAREWRLSTQREPTLAVDGDALI